ncbi:MAG: glycosyltransferase family 2 protein [Syntrophobacteraceae bacterium]
MTEAHKLSVCICTYKRPHMLEQLLLNLDLCTRSEFFNFSVIVVDNDTLQSAEATVKGMQRKVSFEIKYCIEHHPAIPKARNRAVREADGNFIVFIDDDEIPSAEWLLNLYKTAQKYRVDGVLGPVKPVFECTPPDWVIEGGFFERPSFRTGHLLEWAEMRTGNVLFDRRIFKSPDNYFDERFLHGEDKELFERLIRKGYLFVWCNEAPVFEIQPQKRLNARYLLKRALIRGSYSVLHASNKAFSLGKSVIAINIYILLLPLFAMLKKSLFMLYFVKTFDHVGCIVGLVKYISRTR